MPLPILGIGAATVRTVIINTVRGAVIRSVGEAAGVSHEEGRRSAMAAARVSSGAAAGIGGSGATVRFGVDTVRFERSLRRRPREVRRAAQIASVRAANAAGRWGTTRIRRSLSELLNVPQKTLRGAEFIRRASYRGGRFTPYEARWKLRHFRVAQLRGVRFRPDAGQQWASQRQFGTLRFREYGKSVELDRVMRVRGPKGARFYRLRSKPKGRSFQGRFRAVPGTFLKAGYREPRGLKGQVMVPMRREFVRQYRLQREKDRARGRP